ncbi:UNVERIFIED_CONTAM: hypothetical protein K2H54_012083 [Gekko kuhli]
MSDHITQVVLAVKQNEALEKEKQSSKDAFPSKGDTSVRETISLLLQALSIRRQSTHKEVQDNSLKELFDRLSGKWTKSAGVGDILDLIAQRLEEEAAQLEYDEGYCALVTPEFAAYVEATEPESALKPEDVATEISRHVLDRVLSTLTETVFVRHPSSAQGEPDLQEPCARPQLQPPPPALGEELLLRTLKKVLHFAASYYKEALPSSSHLKANRGSRHPEALGKAWVDGNFAQREFSETVLPPRRACRLLCPLVAKALTLRLRVIRDFFGLWARASRDWGIQARQNAGSRSTCFPAKSVLERMSAWIFLVVESRPDILKLI